MEAKQNNLLIIDGHEDLAYNAIQFGRDYTRSALAIRRDERGTPAQARHRGQSKGMRREVQEPFRVPSLERRG